MSVSLKVIAVSGNKLNGILYTQSALKLCNINIYYCVLFYYLGTVPSQLCSLTSLSYLDVTSMGAMSVTCAMWCISTVTTKYIPSLCAPTFQDVSICGLIGALNIASKTGYSMWTCSALGYANNPCTAPWSGLACSSGFVNSITLNSLSLKGI